MKITSLAVALVLGFSLWILFPFIFITINDLFNIPVFDFFIMKIIGVFLIILALIPILYAIFIFKKVGRGTPVPVEPPKKLVIRGFYRYTRNPMYICHLVIFLGETIIFGRPLLFLYLILSFFAFDLYLQKWEEPRLMERFGKEYLDYTKKVPRWLVK